MQRSTPVQRIVFCLPPYGTPHSAPRNIPTFCVNRMQDAGGVCEQKIPAL